MTLDISFWTTRALRAKREAHLALSIHEGSTSRVIILEDLVKSISGSPVDIYDYFREAISCLEHKSLRAAIVLSWCGYFHIFTDRLFEKHAATLALKRPNWNMESSEGLRETANEANIIVAAKDVGFINNTQRRIVDGQLSERNRCAHPTLYNPSLNYAIGYVDATINQALSYVD